MLLQPVAEKVHHFERHPNGFGLESRFEIEHLGDEAGMCFRV
jgi:hypothetical protein